MATNNLPGSADLTTWFTGFEQRLSAFDQQQKTAQALANEGAGPSLWDFVKRSYFSGDFFRNATSGTLSATQEASYGGNEAHRALDSNLLGNLFDAAAGKGGSKSSLIDPSQWSTEGILLVALSVVALFLIVRGFTR